MRRKTGWLSVLITLTYWLGGIFGCSSPVTVDDLSPQAQVVRVSNVPPATQAVTTQPAGTSLDRSTWPTLQIEPVTLDVQHHPVYFHDFPMGGDTVAYGAVGSGAPASVTSEMQLEAALGGATNAGLTRNAVAGIFIAPVKTAVDLVSLPVESVRAAPWGWNEPASPWYGQPFANTWLTEAYAPMTPTPTAAVASPGAAGGAGGR